MNGNASDLYSNIANNRTLPKYVAEMLFSVDVLDNTVLHATVHAVMTTPQSEENACTIIQLLQDAFCRAASKDNANTQNTIN